MKIIDCELKGNVVRFYLGDKDAKFGWTNPNYKYEDGTTPDWLKPSDDFYGDDWDDAPYEHNCGTVYSWFVKGYKDIAFDFDDVIMEPSDNYINSNYCRDDFKERKVPLFIVIPKDIYDKYYCDAHDIDEWMKIKGVITFYMLDEMEPEHEITWNKVHNVSEKELQCMWTKEQVENYRESIDRTKNSLCAIAKKYHPSDYGYMMAMMKTIINNMYEYFDKGVNVYQCDDERLRTAKNLKHAKELFDSLDSISWSLEHERVKELFAYIGEHILEWWD